LTPHIQQRRHAAHHDRCERDARSEHSVLCPLHQEEDTHAHAQEHAPADACARARLPPLRASMRAGSTLCSMPVAICAYARFVATMPTASASAQGAGKEGRDLAPRGEQAARDGGGRPERGCLGLMMGHCSFPSSPRSNIQGGPPPGPDSGEVRNSPGILKKARFFKEGLAP
jgi:hypothetical protein